MNYSSLSSPSLLCLTDDVPDFRRHRLYIIENKTDDFVVTSNFREVLLVVRNVRGGAKLLCFEWMVLKTEHL